jgi:hypothetical protein
MTFLYGSSFTESFEINYDSRHIYEINKNVAKIDDETRSYPATDFQTAYSLYLGATNNSGSALGITPMLIYSSQIYDNGTLVRDFVPCVKNTPPKNLLDINNLTAFAAQATRYTIADNKLTLTSYSQSNKWHQIRFYVNSFDASLHVGKQVTWSFDAEEMLSEYRYQPTINGYNESKGKISSAQINFSGEETGRKSIIYTIPENCRYIGIEFQAPLTTEDLGERIVGVFSSMQLEIGDTATEFEPYTNGIGLLDMVEQKFYGNAGTGTFIGSEVE